MQDPVGKQPLVLQNSDSDKDLTPSQDRDTILAVMARVNNIARSPDADIVIKGMIDLMMEMCAAESADFFQIDEVTDELVLTHVCGDAESQYLVGLRLNRQQGLPGLAFCDTRVIVVGDLPSEPDWLRVMDPKSAPRKRSVVSLPVIDRDKTLGVIQIYNYQQAELDLLTALCDRLAVELNRQKVARERQQSNQRLVTLLEMIGEVAGTLDRDRILRLVTENAARLVGAERSSIFLVEPNTREMMFQVAYQTPTPSASPGPRETVLKPGGQAQEKEPHQAGPGSKTRHSKFEPGEFSYFNRSAITVPLKSVPPNLHPTGDEQKHILGGLMVLNKQNASFAEEDAQVMQILADQTSTFLQVAEMYEGAGDLFLRVIQALAAAIDAKDPYTQGHSQRVSDYAVLIAKELGIEDTLVNDLRIGSLFHDIGKIGIPDAILLKNGKLTDAEMEVIRRHPRLGANILSQVKLLEPMLPAIVEHHERLDGSGYPARLTDSRISWMGRIVAVADVYDAMTSNRPYRGGLSRREVLSFLHHQAGIQFDEECVCALDQAVNRPNLDDAERNRPAGG